MGGEINHCVKDFASEHQQFVVFKGALSGTDTVKSGMPQGSVLGPIIFITYMNANMAYIDCEIKLFARDCILYREISDRADHSAQNISLEKIPNWCAYLQESITLPKTVCMVV